MTCDEAAEFVLAWCDGERIPSEAAEHLGSCAACRERLGAYAAIGAEVRRVASLEEATPVQAGAWGRADRSPLSWWQKGRETMRIPRFTFVLMLVAIVLLTGGLALVRARAAAHGWVLWLMMKLPGTGLG
jgi:predicted anti-sigma-YlaC factor YlaD